MTVVLRPHHKSKTSFPQKDNSVIAIKLNSLSEFYMEGSFTIPRSHLTVVI